MRRVADSCVSLLDGGVWQGLELGVDADLEDDSIATTTTVAPVALPACAEELVGLYAVRDTTYEFGAPLGTREVLATTLHNRVRIVVEQGRLRLHTEHCMQQTRWGDSYSEVPQAYIGYHGTPPALTLEVDCEKRSFRAQAERVVAGFSPELPAGCRSGERTATNWQGTCRCPEPGTEQRLPLANDADECRVLDADADGRPGLTTVNRLFGFEAWVAGAYVQEGYAEGNIAEDGHHTGAWHDLGSESVLLACDPVVRALTGGECPQPHLSPCPAPGLNEMVFVPIDEAVGCGALTATLDRLFEAHPPPGPPDLAACL